MIFALLAVVVSSLTGWFLLAAIWPRLGTNDPGLVLRASIAGGIGLLLSSMVYFGCLATGLTAMPIVVSIDVLVLGLSFALARRVDPSVAFADPGRKSSPTSFDWLMRAGLAGALAANVFGWVARYRDEPLGFWDAFAIWNLKARFFFFESGAHWQRAFADSISWSHTDYPLLLPLNVARLWTYAGAADQTVSVLLSVFFTLLAVALLFGALSMIRDRLLGALAALALLACPALMGQAVWQIADIPVGYFLSASLAAVLASSVRGQPSGPLLIIAGLCAGSAAWTKNEGLLFALAIPVGMMLVGSHPIGERMARVVNFAKGLAPPLALLVLMKVTVAGSSDLVTDFELGSLARIFEVERHLQIMTSFARTLLMLTGVPLLAVLFVVAVWRGFVRDRPSAHGTAPMAIALLLQLSGYYFVYLITERDLAWHLGTSNLRLFVQLWPSALLLFFVGLQSFETADSKPTET